MLETELPLQNIIGTEVITEKIKSILPCHVENGVTIKNVAAPKMGSSDL